MKFFAPPVSQKDLRQSVAAFTVSHFVPVPGRAVTGTVDGDLVLWEGTKVGQTVCSARLCRPALQHHLLAGFVADFACVLLTMLHVFF